MRPPPPAHPHPTPTHGGGCPVARDVPCPCWGELWLCRAGALRSATAARTAGRRPRLLPRRAAERTGTGCQGRSGRDAGAAGSGAGGHSPIWAPRGRASPARSSTRAAIVPGQPKGTGAGSRRRSPSASGRGGRRWQRQRLRLRCCGGWRNYGLSRSRRRQAEKRPRLRPPGRPRASRGWAEASVLSNPHSEMLGPISKPGVATGDPGAPPHPHANEKSLYEGSYTK